MRRCVLAAALLLAACGDGSEAAGPTTTTTLVDLDGRPPLVLVREVDGGTELASLDRSWTRTIEGLTPAGGAGPTLVVVDTDLRRHVVDDAGNLEVAPVVAQHLPEDDPPPGAMGPDGAVVGHWRDRWPSPDGDHRLGQWSGECESQTAWIAEAGGAWRPVLPGPDGWPHASTALGWAPDGRAVVSFDDVACGTPAPEAGTYLLDPTTGALERVGAPAAGAWTR